MRFLSSCLFIFLTSFSLFAITTRDSLDFLSDAQRSELYKTGKIEELSPNKKTHYIPSFLDEESIDLLTKRIKKVSPNIVMEGVFLVPKSSKSSMLYFYNSLLNISSFKEIYYFNEDKGVSHPLFGFSHAIANQKDKEELENPLIRDLEEIKEVYVYQNFLPVNHVVSLYTYHYSPEKKQLHFHMQNLEAVKYNGFTAIGSHKLNMEIFVQETETDFIVYAVAYAKVASLFGKGEKLFSFRIKGLINWYFNEYISPLINK